MLQRITFWLDRYLWQKGLGHPQIMPVLRNEILCALLFLLLGLLLFPYSTWLFWFGAGMAIMALTFYSLADFFLHTSMDTYSALLFFKVLIRWGARFLITICLLYVALIICAAQVSAILSGLACASFLALVTYAFSSRRR